MDVYDLDPEALSSVPAPVAAVILLFPDSKVRISFKCISKLNQIFQQTQPDVLAHALL